MHQNVTFWVDPSEKPLRGAGPSEKPVSEWGPLKLLNPQTYFLNQIHALSDRRETGLGVAFREMQRVDRCSGPRRTKSIGAIQP